MYVVCRLQRAAVLWIQLGPKILDGIPDEVAPSWPRNNHGSTAIGRHSQGPQLEISNEDNPSLANVQFKSETDKTVHVTSRSDSRNRTSRENANAQTPVRA